jgi:hypothetical protein
MHVHRDSGVPPGKVRVGAAAEGEFSETGRPEGEHALDDLGGGAPLKWKHVEGDGGPAQGQQQD